MVIATGCKGPSVNLSTNEPIKVDINMKLDVYQHSQGTPKTASPTTPSGDDVAGRRRNRMGELQLMKDSRIIGENHLGLVEVRNEPPGDYGKYVRRTVDAENADRQTEMLRIAKERNITIEDVRKEQAKLTRANAFNGEWIEEPQPDGGFAWVKKGH